MKKIIILLLAIALSCTTAACTSQAADEAPSPVPEASARQTLEAFGTVIATEVQNITLDFQAPVKQIHVIEGEHVKAGQPLITLDLTEIENTIATKELSLDGRKSNIEKLLGSNDLEKLRNDLKNAQDIYDKSSAELNAKEQLFQSGSISQSELNSFKSIVDSDKKAVQDITYAINSLKNSKGIESEQQQLEVSILESDLKLLKSRLDKSYLKGSDIICDITSAVVYEIGYSQGDIAGPQVKLLSIMDADSLQIEADIPEEFIKDIKLGFPVTVTPIADKTRTYNGKITAISARAVSRSGGTQVPVRIELDDPDDFLLPGFNVDVVINIGE